ncbi:hypothetical protein C8J57DRAFT_1512273 [Mycena rebaudengoi]|nr:hypothetical protein C8J57DRAFT_1512273 [Mycena rebaudengoi]
MVRLFKARISDKAFREQRLAKADEDTRHALTVSLVGTFHYKKLVQSTLNGHKRTKELWEKEQFFLIEASSLALIPNFMRLTHPPPDIIKEFVRWMGYTLQGRLDTYVVQSTVQGYIHKFYACAPAYFNSVDFEKTSPLSTVARVKPVADVVDLDILVRGILQDKKHFRTHRRHSQLIYSALISCHRALDALMYALHLAFRDQIFQDLHSVEETFFPTVAPTRAHKLRIKASAMKLPVFRCEVYENGKWIVSEPKSLPYHMAATYLRTVSLSLGFIIYFTYYCFRRCSANNMSARLSGEERTRMLGQMPNSNQFFESYQSRLAAIDLGAILAGHLDENQDNQSMMKAVCGMSKDRDPNVPISLTVQKRSELADDELLLAKIASETTKLLTLISDEDFVAQDRVLSDLRAEVRKVNHAHNVIVVRETHAQVAHNRKKIL